MTALFTDEAGVSLKFWLASDPSGQYAHKIIANGGDVVTRKEPPENDQVILLSHVPLRNRISFTFDLVDQSIANAEIADFRKYKLAPGEHPVEKRGFSDTDTAQLAVRNAAEAENSLKRAKLETKQPHKTFRFNAEKDEYILEQVRLHPKYRTSHKFFADLSRHEKLAGHTGNSVRSRFRLHLLPSLEYVYQIDDHDQVVLDANGDKIRVPLVDLPKTLKNRFTAEEDYYLCKEVYDHVLKKDPKRELPKDDNGDIDENYLSVGVSYFDEYSKRHPEHSSSSWRDRYRKFAKSVGVQIYIRYYEECIRAGITPRPMKDQTSRNSKQKRGLGMNEKFLPRVSHIEVEDNALDEEIGEVKNSNIDDALKEVDSNHTKISNDFDSSDESDDEVIFGFHAESQSQFDLQALHPIEYAPKDVTVSDLLLPAFYDIDRKNFIQIILKVLQRVDQTGLQGIYEDFQKLGITYQFTGHIFMATNISALHINMFLEAFMKRLSDFSDSDVHRALRISNVPGIWNNKTDKLLKAKKFDQLRRLHSEEDIRHRIEFLKQLERF